MTNGEKLVKVFPDIELYQKMHGGIQIDFDSVWWNAEYQEPTPKNDLGVDCNNCKNNFHRGDGTSYCATGDGMCHYECEEPTTKNNLAVDCRSLEDIKKLVESKADDLDGVMLDASGVIIGLYFAIANDLSPVTPISKDCTDCIAEDKTFMKMDRIKQLLYSDKLDDLEVLEKIREVVEE